MQQRWQKHFEANSFMNFVLGLVLSVSQEQQQVQKKP
jgi:hypothetical protein